MKLIDADALYEFMREKTEDVSPAEQMIADLKNEHLRIMLDHFATVDAEPVRHGRWVPTIYDGYADECPVYNEWECSECRFECDGDVEPPLNYCPKCGAKMDGDEE